MSFRRNLDFLGVILRDSGSYLNLLNLASSKTSLAGGRETLPHHFQVGVVVQSPTQAARFCQARVGLQLPSSPQQLSPWQGGGGELPYCPIFDWVGRSTGVGEKGLVTTGSR